MTSHPSKAVLVAVMVLAGSYLAPWLLRYPVLLGYTRNWEPDPQFEKLRDTCVPMHPSQLVGCEKFKVIGNDLFAACIGDWEQRRRWFPPMGVFEALTERVGSIRDHVYKVDLKTKALTLLSMPNFPENIDFCVHGMDVVEVSPGEFSLFLVNHRRSGSVVENFSYETGSSEIIHLGTFDGIHEGLANPNDIFALPATKSSPWSQKAFFVTNDHYFRSSRLGRMLERYLRLPTGSVFYHSTSTGFHRIQNGLSNANGIVGFQGEHDSTENLVNTLFVASILNGVVTAYRYIPGKVTGENGFTKLRDFIFDFVMDNLAISQDGRWLYLTGHGEPTKLDQHWDSPNEIPSASLSYRMSLAELGAYFGNNGETGESRVERIVVDRFGRIGNASTTALGDDKTNKFWISGLTFHGILECDLHTHSPNTDESEGF